MHADTIVTDRANPARTPGENFDTHSPTNIASEGMLCCIYDKLGDGQSEPFTFLGGQGTLVHKGFAMNSEWRENRSTQYGTEPLKVGFS